VVLPHPHVVEGEWFDLPHPAADPFVVGVHAKSLRANMDVLPVAEALADAVTALPGARLQVDVHHEIFDPDYYWYAPQTGAALMSLAHRPRVDMRVHPHFTDDQLWQYLSALTVSVLPYRFGTHSEWLEACHDLGTAVAAPSCGFYAQQQSCAVFGFDEDHFDADSLVDGIADLYRRRHRISRAGWVRRLRQRRHLARAHRVIYERALS
jgi:hypothetical protein